MSKKRTSRKPSKEWGKAIEAIASTPEVSPELPKDIPDSLAQQSKREKMGRTHRLQETSYRKVRSPENGYGRDVRFARSYKTSYTKGGR